MISVVIPAHNEGAVIARCLQRLTEGEGADQLRITVVCNGCSDDTAERAASFKGVNVVEISVASKIAALNAGDKHVDTYPVAYVDADVAVSAKDIVNAASQLGASVHVVAPKILMDLSSSSLLVKAFYAVWLKLPYFADQHMVGSGIYILSEVGRKRFEQFPNIISDDGYVRSLFSNSERVTAQNSVFTVFAPKNVGSLIKIKTRARLGNMQVVQRYPNTQLGGENTLGSFVKLLLHKPWLIPAGVVYVLVQWTTKRRAVARLLAQDVHTWERDNSTRT